MRAITPLYSVVATAAGDVVVEVFAIRAPVAPTLRTLRYSPVHPHP